MTTNVIGWKSTALVIGAAVAVADNHAGCFAAVGQRTGCHARRLSEQPAGPVFEDLAELVWRVRQNHFKTGIPDKFLRPRGSGYHKE